MDSWTLDFREKKKSCHISRQVQRYGGKVRKRVLTMSHQMFYIRYNVPSSLYDSQSYLTAQLTATRMLHVSCFISYKRCEEAAL